jgi:hypothetical protein
LVRGHHGGASWARFAEQPSVVREFDVKPTPAIRVAHDAMMQESNVKLFAAAFQEMLARTRA